MVSGLRDTPLWRKINEDKSSKRFVTEEIKLFSDTANIKSSEG